MNHTKMIMNMSHAQLVAHCQDLKNEYDRLKAELAECSGMKFILACEEYRNKITDLEKELAALRSELETERLRLAACGVAALGYFEGCKDEYKSASLDDVLRLYSKVEALRSASEPVAWIRKSDLQWANAGANGISQFSFVKREGVSGYEIPLCLAPPAQSESDKDAELSGLPMVIAGAIFDFAGFITSRDTVIEVGSTANASPVANLVKEWAELRGLSLDDAAVLSWQELLK